ncbi:hypothetical protein BBFL7_02577 [Flavobacteria bacterium BBFL7]|nr:hypothetical protein BBFL7_02577 [Flavobacteria bacterium BBFL7]
MKRIYIFFLFTIFIISCDSNQRIEMSKYDYLGIEELKMTALIDSIHFQRTPSFHGMGIVYLDVINSNQKDYDPIKYQSNYLIRIKKSKAELYIATGTLQVGDTIKINLPNESLTYYSSVKNEFIEFKPAIYNSSFFKFIERKGYQKL